MGGFVACVGAMGIMLQMIKILTGPPPGEPRSFGAEDGKRRWSALDWMNVAHYIVMASACIPVWEAMHCALPRMEMQAIWFGGLLYSVGVPCLLSESVEFHNAAWHVCVVLA